MLEKLGWDVEKEFLRYDAQRERSGHVEYPICEECGDEITENRLLYDNYGDIYCMRCAYKIFKGDDFDEDLVTDSHSYIRYED